jgi:hypothetical protein
MDILGLPLQDNALTWSYANTTLIISYAKPMEVLQAVSVVQVCNQAAELLRSA